MGRAILRSILIVLWLISPGILIAQETAQEEADKGFLTRLIQDNLSGAGRTVSIDGFQGALSSRATVRSMTIADSQGIWLTLQDVTLDWDRAALLSGKIDVTELTAAQITLARLPVTDPSLPTPEAKGFSLPDLPVSVEIKQLQADQIILGATVLGEDLSFKLMGALSLSGGEGTAQINATRIDGQQGVFGIDASYSNSSQVLGLTLQLDEAPGGIASRLLNLPGDPSVLLSIAGTGPISDYAADLTIATDGADRLRGRIELTSDAPAADQPDAAVERRFNLTAQGDVTPLFLPQYRDFFGTDVSLTVAGQRDATGNLRLSAFDLSTRALKLNGSAEISAEGWPRAFDLTGTMANPDGTALRLPMSGPQTEVSSATLALRYDQTAGDAWTLDMGLEGFTRPGLSLAGVTVTGGGTIANGEGGSIGAVTANIGYAARGLTLDNGGMADALGDELTGQVRLQYNEGDGTTIDELSLKGPGIDVAANGTVVIDPDNGLTVASTVQLTADRMARFATLAGLAGLGGSADLNIVSTVRPIAGAIEASVSGGTVNLTTGISQLDPLLTGDSKVSLGLARDEAGIRLSDLRIDANAVTLRADATVTSTQSRAALDLKLTDVGLVDDRISGPLGLTVNAGRDPLGQLTAFGTADLSGNRATITASRPQKTDAVPEPDVSLRLTADLPRLGDFAKLANRALAGGVTLAVEGTGLPDGNRYDLRVTGQSDSTQTGIPELDGLLRGAGTFAGRITRAGETYGLNDLDVATPALALKGNAATGPAGTTANVDAAVTDLSLIRAGLAGPATVVGTANIDAGGLVTVDARATAGSDTLALIASRPQAGTAPIKLDLTANVTDLSKYQALAGRALGGGITAQITGSGQLDASQFDLTLDGSTQSLRIGNATVDKLLAGAGTFAMRAERPQAGGLILDGVEVRTPNVSMTGNLRGQDGAGQADFQARLSDIGLFTPDFSGPATANGTAQRTAGGDWVIDTNATGPGGTTATARGRIGPTGTLAINLNGSVPLGLLNGSLEPRRLEGLAGFDLSINGPAALDSIAGTVTLNGARLSAPTLRQAVEGIGGTIALRNGQAVVALNGTISTGGTLRIDGPVGLSAPYPGDITASFDRIILRDPNLYDTSVNGTISLSGPLAGGAQISGLLDLGETNVQVPSSAIGALGDLPEVTHVGPSQDVRQTLARAGLGVDGKETVTAGNSGPAFPLNITVRAPSRIFVRGRGLDAELGGALTLTGTTQNVIPLGQFDLIRGRLSILQQRFTLTEGFAALQGGFIPYIRLQATTTARTGTVITIRIEGEATAPVVTFTSAPELPQDEILAQLIFGRDLASITPLQAVQLASAVGTLAGRGGAGVIDNLRSGFGLDDFEVTTDANGDAAVRAGKYLSDNIYTDITVGASGTSEINLNLDVTPSITAKGSVSSDGDTSLGVFFQRDY